MKKKIALHFRNEFKKARDSALKDAEGYQQILFVLERMGAYLLKKKGDLGKYQPYISSLVKKHRPSFLGPSDDYHINFDRLYKMVREGRNDALHQGAVARIMTSHSVQLSMMLEDTLMVIAKPEKIGEYMVTHPVCAYEWQPISFIRQIMLENSFSHIPFYRKEQWHVISDLDVATIRHKEELDGRDQSKRLMDTLKCCIDSKKITLREARTVSPDRSVCDVLKCAGDQECAGGNGWPVLVKRDDCKELLGIVTPYDLM